MKLSCDVNHIKQTFDGLWKVKYNRRIINRTPEESNEDYIKRVKDFLSPIFNEDLEEVFSNIFLPYFNENNVFPTINEDFINKTFNQSDDTVSTDGISDSSKYYEYNEDSFEGTKTLTGYFVESQYRLNKAILALKEQIIRECVFDYQDSNKKIDLNKFSINLSAVKLALALKLNKNLNLGIDFNAADEDDITYIINKVIQDSIKYFENSNNRSEETITLYLLANFNDILDELGFIKWSKYDANTGKGIYKNYQHSVNMYEFGLKEAETITTYNQSSDTIDIDTVSPEFLKTIASILPIGSFNSFTRKFEGDEYYKIGWNGFTRTMANFYNWISVEAPDEYWNAVQNNDISGIIRALDVYKKLNSTSRFASDINMQTIESLEYFIFNKYGCSPVPEQIRNAFIAQAFKTVPHEYLSYTYDYTKKRISYDILSEKLILSESSRVTNLITSAVANYTEDRDNFDGINNPYSLKELLGLTINPGLNENVTNFNLGDRFGNILISVTYNPGTNQNTVKITDSFRSDPQDPYGEIKRTIELINTVFGGNAFMLPDTNDEESLAFISRYLNGQGNKKTLLKVFGDIIGITLAASNNKKGFRINRDGSLNLSNYFKQYDAAAQLIYVISGYDNKNVVKDVENNNLPQYGLLPPIYKFRTLLNKYKESGSRVYSMNPYILGGENPIAQVVGTLIRNGAQTKLGTKKASQNNMAEAFYEGCFLDFHEALNFDETDEIASDTNRRANKYLTPDDKNRRTIFAQSTVFSDKAMQFVFAIRIAKELADDFKAIESQRITEYDKNGNRIFSDAEKRCINLVREWQYNKYHEIFLKTLNKWQQVFPEVFNNITDPEVFSRELTKLSKKYSLSEIRKKFNTAGIDLKEELDYTGKDGELIYNEAIIARHNITFADNNSTAKYFELQQALAAKDLFDNHIVLWADQCPIKGLDTINWVRNGKVLTHKVYKNINGEWIELENSGAINEVFDKPKDFDKNFRSQQTIKKNYRVELNPIIKAYSYAEPILTNGADEIFFGLFENNPGKMSGNNAETKCASRLLAQYKRTVSAGSTVHTYLQNLKYGVGQIMNIACVDDLRFPYAANSIGQVYSKDPHDGSGWRSPYQAIYENNSLVHSSINPDLAKSIFHDVDEDGNGKLLKWAAFTLTNSIRQISNESSEVDAEIMFRKMHSALFTFGMRPDSKLYSFSDYFDNNIYRRDPGFGYFKLTNITTDENGLITVTWTPSNENGKLIEGEIVTETFTLNNLQIWELDQIFGGAYCMELDSATNTLKNSSKNNTIVAKMLAENLQNNGKYAKDNIIAYVVNKSAIKRGITNTNDSSTLTDVYTPFTYTTISTQMGGLMMDTEHEVDGDIREGSQMISALMQNGYSEESANLVYKNISQVITHSKEKMFEDVQSALKELINDEDVLSPENEELIREKLVELLTASLKSSGKSVGNSLTFTKLLEKNNIKVSFTQSELRSKFISAIDSYLSQRIIIRRMAGTQTVNTPSRGMIQYHHFNGIDGDIEHLRKFMVSDLKSDPEKLRKFLEYTEVDFNEDVNSYVPTYNELKQFMWFALNDEMFVYNELTGKMEPTNPYITDCSFNDINVGDTILISGITADSELYKVLTKSQKESLITQDWVTIKINVGSERDIWKNLAKSDPNISFKKWGIKGTDLKQPSITYKVGNETYNEWDFDVVRSMCYIRELFTKNKLEDLNSIAFKDVKQQVIIHTLDEIKNTLDKIKDQILKKKNNEENNLQCSILERWFNKATDDGKILISSVEDIYKLDDIHRVYLLKALQQYQQDIFIEIGNAQTNGTNYNLPTKQFAFNGTEISDIKVTPGEIAMSAAYAQLFGIKEGDDLNEILAQGSDFFRKRAINNSTFQLQNTKYDAVLEDQEGHKILVKVGTTPEGTFSTDLFKKGHEDWYYKDELICSKSDYNAGIYKFYTIQDAPGQPQYDLIVVDSLEALQALENNKLFIKSNTYFNFGNKTQDSITDEQLWDYCKDRYKEGDYYILKTTGKKDKKIKDFSEINNISELTLNENKRKEIRLDKLAEILFESFKGSLEYIGTRIPSQAMQSFMPLKVKLFIGNNNQIFLPGAMHWFQGADYDVDKTYMMRLSLLGARLTSGSNLDNIFGYRLAAKLPPPNKNIIIEEIGIKPNTSTYSDIMQHIGRNKVVLFENSQYLKLSDLKEAFEESNIGKIKLFNILNEILKNFESGVGAQIYVIDDTEDIDTVESERIVIKLKNYINAHNSSKNANIKSALNTKTMVNAFDILTNTMSFINESEPIDFGEIGDVAKNSALGGREKILSPWCCTVKWIMQEQFQMGKTEIGIIATAIKTYLGKSAVVNRKIREATKALREGRVEQGLELLNQYIFTLTDIDGTSRIGLLANVNLNPLIDLIIRNEKFQKPIQINPNSAFCKKLKTIGLVEDIDGISYINLANIVLDKDYGLISSNAEEDVLMALSSLLSAATDNAKELILSKINASPQTVDLFCSMLASGKSLHDILKIFESPAFSLVDKFSKTSIFSETGTNAALPQIIDFILGTGDLMGNRSYYFTSFIANKEMLFNGNQWTLDRYSRDLYDQLVETYGEDSTTEEANKAKIVMVNQILQNPENVKKIIKKINELIADYNSKYAPSDEDEDFDIPEDSFDIPEDNWWDDNIDEQFDDNFENQFYKKTMAEIKFSDFTILDLRVFRKHLDDLEYISNFKDIIESSRESLQWTRDVVCPISDENKILGSIMKINQGLPSTFPELRSFVRKIEVFVNNRISAESGNFSLSQFIANENYRREWINKYEDIKAQTNILRVIDELPNFKEMFFTVNIAIGLSNLQFFSRETNKLASEMEERYLGGKRTHKISSDGIKVIESVLNAAIPFNFLRTLDIQLHIPAGVKFYSGGTNVDNWYRDVNDDPLRQLDLGTIKGMATFKYLFEQIFVKQLLQDPNYNSNGFIKSLIRDDSKVKRGNSIRHQIKCNIDMTNVESSVILSRRYNDIVTEFNKIADNKIEFLGNTWKLADLVFIYNLIVNKGGIGNKSMTKLFIEYGLAGEGSSLFNEYNKFLYALDTSDRYKDIDIQSLFDQDKLLDDILVNCAYNEKLKNSINNYHNEKDALIETINERGKIVGVIVNGITFRPDTYNISDVTFLEIPNSAELGVIKGTKTRMGEFRKSFTNRDVAIRITNLLVDYFSKNNPGLVTIVDEQWMDINNWTQEMKNYIEKWGMVEYDGKLYIYNNAISPETPFKLMYNIVASIIRLNKDYSAAWDEIYENLSKKTTFTKIQKECKIDNYDISLRDRVISRYLSDIFDEELRISKLRRNETDSALDREITSILNKIFGLNNLDSNADLSKLTIVDVMSQFGDILNKADISASIKADAWTKKYVSYLIDKGYLTIKGDC